MIDPREEEFHLRTIEVCVHMALDRCREEGLKIPDVITRLEEVLTALLQRMEGIKKRE